MKYQWGRKDPFTFATNSQGVGNETGKYPVKIYTIDGVLIYQESNGSSNTDKQPAGGVISSSTLATSMMETVKNPNTLYGLNGPVISQPGHTKDLWCYYWTSCSRGTEGNGEPMKYHNNYLNGFTSNSIKSIYDPCPYGFKISTNGTYNSVSVNRLWVYTSYSVGAILMQNELKSWYIGLGNRYPYGGRFTYCGYHSGYWSSNIFDDNNCYYLRIQENVSSSSTWYTSHGYSVRCIDFAMLVLLLLRT